MPVQKISKALIAFADSSFLFVELSRTILPADGSLFCASIVGLPNGTPMDKPTMATSIYRLAQAGQFTEIMLPMSRINGVSILEEYPKKGISKDIEMLWTDAKKV